MKFSDIAFKGNGFSFCISFTYKTIFLRTRSLCSPACPTTRYIDESDLELEDLPAFASKMSGLRVCTTTPNLKTILVKIIRYCCQDCQFYKNVIEGEIWDLVRFNQDKAIIITVVGSCFKVTLLKLLLFLVGFIRASLHLSVDEDLMLDANRLLWPGGSGLPILTRAFVPVASLNKVSV